MIKNLVIPLSAFLCLLSGGAFAGTPVFTDSPSIIIPAKSNNALFPEFLSDFDAKKSVDYVRQFCSNRSNYIFSAKKRSKSFYPKAVNILAKYKVPAAFRILLTLESDCNPNVVSHAGAVGYWQFIDEVAGEYGMKYVHQLTKTDKEKLKKEKPLQADSIIKAVSKQRDDRKNFTKSTHAAARYLRDRLRDFGGDVLLACASYNCGLGNVRNAMYKSGETNPSFWDIKAYLPKETQNYVMNFIALNVAYANYDLLAANNLRFEINKQNNEHQKNLENGTITTPVAEIK